MKNLIFTTFLVLLTSLTYGQTCDIFTTGLKSDKQEVVSGESVDLIFSVLNDAKGVQCEYIKNSVQVLLFLPDQSLNFESFVSPVNGKGLYFDWIYDETNRTIIGVNHTAIPDGAGEENIKVRVKAGAVNVPEVNKTIGLTILQNFEGEIFPSNNASNDNSILTLRMKAGSVQAQPLFQAVAADCNEIKLTLNNAVGKDIVSYEVSRSQDGKVFNKIAEFFAEPTNNAETYVYNDKSNMTDGFQYVYEITAVLKDGSRKTLGKQSVVNDCSKLSADFDFFPNPAVDKMYIRLKGAIQNETVQMSFTNNKGEIVKVSGNVGNTNNEVFVGELPSGVYYLTISGKENIGRKRFVKIAH